jgi:hypothetical protein
MRLVRKIQIIVAMVAVFAACSADLAGQAGTDQVSGVVTDTTGAVVPGAKVQMKNTDTDAVRTAVSDERGAYSVTNLPIGPYTLQVEKAGFEKYVQNGIVLEVNTNPSIVVALHVGAQTQEVIVQADAAMVETQNSNVGQVINPQQVIDLPLNGRQPTDLIALSGAALNTNGGGGTTNTLDYPSAVSYSIAGSQPNATNYYLDGSQNLDYRTNVGLPLPFPDALSEFNINISAMPANLGVHPGGTVNAVTRGGGNRFHGGLFEFVRNGVLDATTRTYATRAGVVTPGVRDTLQRNQFGGTFGGPIKKDKLFFFGGYQGTIQNSTNGASTTSIPTPAMLGIGTGTGPGQANTYPGYGDFTAVAAGNTNGCSTGTIKTAFTTGAGSPAANVIAQQYMGGTTGTSSAQIMQSFYKNYISTAGIYDNCGDYTYVADPVYYFENQIVGRVDWQRTSSDTIFGRYFISKYSQPSYYTAGNIFSSSGVGSADQIQNVAIGDTHVLSVHAIYTARLSFARTSTQRTSNAAIPTLCSIGVNVSCPVAHDIYMTIIGGVKPGFLGYDYENSYGATDGYAWTNGKHQINAGFTWLHVQMNGDGTFQENAEAGFTSATTGVTFGDEATGNLDSILQGEGQLSRDGMNQPSAYVQDAWKVLPRFQLTGGLRWDPFIAQHNKYGEVGDFSLAGFTAGTQSTQYTNAPPGMTFAGDAGFHGMSDTNNYIWSFAPRLGFVWDTTGKGKMTLRGGYGYFYDSSVLWNTMHVVLNPPWGETLSFTPNTVAAGGGLASPYGGGGNVIPNPFPFYNPPKSFVFPTSGTYIFENQANKPEAVQQWNLAFQDQLTSNLLLSVNYIGNVTHHVWLGISQNSASPYNFATASSTGFCQIPYNVGTAAAPNIVNLNYTVCNQISGTTETDTTGYKVTNVNARRALNISNPKWGPYVQGGLTTAFSWGDGAYNAMLVSLEKRMSHGFSVLGNYTWSHCMDDGDIGQDIGNTPMNPLNPKGTSWGNCSYNKKGIANLSVVGQSPRFENKAVNALASHWNGSGIFTASTGYYYSMADGYDASLTGIGSDRPNIVGNPKVGGTVAANPTCTAPAQVHTKAYWYNPCAFALAPLGSFGGEVRNDQEGPANWNLNLALWRSFPLPEKITLDFRVEAFNALNHAQIGLPNATLATSGSSTGLNSNAGLITASQTFVGPRIMQLAVKANF